VSAPWTREKAERRVISPDERWAAEIRERVLADCHDAGQRDAVASRHRYFTWLVGRGGGKTSGYKAKYLLGLTSVPRGRFIFAAPTREMATDLLWDPLKDSIERLGIEASFSEVRKICVVKRTGARLKLVGADDKREMGKQRGQPFDGVGVDEVVEFPPQLIEWFVDRIIAPRLGERGGWLGLASTPGHVLRGLFYEATRPGSKLHCPFDKLHESPNWGGWVSFAWSLESVVALPDAIRRYPAIVANWVEALRIKALRQWGDDNPIWMREYRGKWAADNTLLVFEYLPHKASGEAWNEWDPPRRGTMRIAELPPGRTDWLFVVTLDEGLSDPFACNAFAFSPSDPTRTIYHVFGMEQGRRRGDHMEGDHVDDRPEAERSKMYAQPIAKLLIGDALDPATPGGLIGELGEWPIGMEGDCGEALLLELANVYGVRVERFDRTLKYKAAAIEVVNGDFSDGRLKILKGSPLATQLGELQWSEDDFGNKKENKAQANHSTDCLVIARKVIGKLITTGTVDMTPSPAAAAEAAAFKRAAAGAAAEDPPDEGPSQPSGFSGMLVTGDYADPWGTL
jgi:hypothetical protein